jgi:hypothetical protein
MVPYPAVSLVSINPAGFDVASIQVAVKHFGIDSDAFADFITAQKSTAGGDVIEHEPSIPDAASTPIDPPAAAVAPHAAPRVAERAAPQTNIVNVVRLNKAPSPSFPGLCNAAALEGVDRDKSATELFYEWNGHGRPP